jgi:hypothetical protein
MVDCYWIVCDVCFLKRRVVVKPVLNIPKNVDDVGALSVKVRVNFYSPDIQAPTLEFDKAALFNASSWEVEWQRALKLPT